MANAKGKQTEAQDEPAPAAQGQKVTKAQEIWDRVEAMIASGVEKSDAFKQIAEEEGRPLRFDPWELLLPQEKDRGR